MGSSEGRTETLVCFALPEEAAPFRKLSAVCGNPGILVTGIGRKNSERKFREALTNFTPKLVLTCGFAGALDPALKRGDVMFDADPNSGLSEKLLAAGAKEGKFHCSPRVAVTGAEKAQLWSTTRKEAVEMESDVIRAICREKKIPSATVRAISDTANEDLPLDFNLLMTPNQDLSFAKLAFAIMKSPGRIPRLLELQRHTRSAAQQLAGVLGGLLRLRGENGI